MTEPPADVGEHYALALAHTFAESAGREAGSLEIEALASFFHQRFNREAIRLPPDGRDEFLSAVAFELLARIGRAKLHGVSSLPELEDMFKRATLTVLDTVRHRIMRARARNRFREHTVENLDTIQGTTSSPDLEALLQRDLASRLSPDEAAVLYLVIEGQTIDEIAEKKNVSKRTIYRALRVIRQLLEEYHREDLR